MTQENRKFIGNCGIDIESDMTSGKPLLLVCCPNETTTISKEEGENKKQKLSLSVDYIEVH